MTDTEFPILDATRPSHEEFGRAILDVFDPVEAYITEADSWVAMPLRLVHNQAAGFHLECGPYEFDRADIEVLRRAIAAYDAATKPGFGAGDD